tara:strand:- start:13344 stop:13973 length:630 start_codon:yes stop_codon:yes gene_type:complete
MARIDTLKSSLRKRTSAQKDLFQGKFDTFQGISDAGFTEESFKFDQSEKTKMFNTLYSGLELADTIKASMDQKKETMQSVEDFKSSLGEGKDLDVDKKTTLMDLLSRKEGSTISDYLYGQDTYSVGDKKIGSLYDVAAMGKQQKSKQIAELFLSKIDKSESLYTPSFNPNEITMDSSINFNSSLYNPVGEKEISNIIDLRGQEESLGFG